MGDFLHAFVPVFVAMDVVGVAPIFLALTHGMNAAERRRVVRTSLLFAAAVSVAFVVLGKAVFVLLGITVADFQVAGGLILIGVAGLDLLTAEPRGVAQGTDVGLVPLAVPLIAGPAVITTAIVAVDLYGPATALAALLANLALCWAVLAHVGRVQRLVGHTGARALSKIVSLLLAAIGVRLVRDGLGAV